jgi:integrase
MFRFLAVTGLRWSELVALRWRDLQFDGAARVKIRRALTRGRYMAPPKSSHGRRDIPLPHDLVHELRGHRRLTEWPGDDDLVFPSTAGSPLSTRTRCVGC